MARKFKGFAIVVVTGLLAIISPEMIVAQCGMPGRPCPQGGIDKKRATSAGPRPTVYKARALSVKRPPRIKIDKNTKPATRKAHDLTQAGIGLFLNGDAEEALRKYEAGIVADPKYADAYHQRGVVRQSRGGWDDAIADYTAAIELDPGDEQPHFRRGEIFLLAKGDLEAAIRDLNRSVELAPYYPHVHFNLANAYNRTKNFDGAISEIAKVLAFKLELSDIEDRKFTAGAYSPGRGHITRKERWLRQ